MLRATRTDASGRRRSLNNCRTKKSGAANNVNFLYPRSVSHSENRPGKRAKNSLTHHWPSCARRSEILDPGRASEKLSVRKAMGTDPNPVGAILADTQARSANHSRDL